MKRIIVVMLVMIMAAILCGCVSKEQRKINEENSSRAEENAIDYVKEKYGFKAKVVETEVDSYGGLFGPEFNGYVFVTMEYDDREFTVYIDGEEENTDGMDDYQQKEIEKYIRTALDKRVDSECDDLLIYNMLKSESSENRDYYFLVDDYFNGENLEEILDTATVCRVCYAENVELSGLDEEYISKLFSENECAIYSYKDSGFYDKNTIYGDLTEINYKYEHALYINESVTYNSRDGYTYYKPEIYSVGEMYYVTEDNLPLDITEYDSEFAKSWNIENASNICTSLYYIPETDCRVTVFFESDKLPNNGEKCGIIRLTKNNEYDSYCVTDIIGEYNVTTLYPHHLECYCAVKDNGIVSDD